MPYPYAYNTSVVPVYSGYAQPYVAPAPIPIQQPQQQQQTQQQPQQQQPNQSQQSEQLISGGFVVIPSEEDVKRYPIAPGNLVTFKVENEPIIIEKSMGRSQFANPEYKYYKLSEYNNHTEDMQTVDNISADTSNSQYTDDIAFMKKSFEHIEKRLESLSDSYVELKKTLSKKQDAKPVKKEGDDA